MAFGASTSWTTAPTLRCPGSKTSVSHRSALSFQYYDEQGQHPRMQEHIYSDCARLYGSQHTWMAFIDADEFFETGTNETLPSILHEFDKVRDVGALGVNWRLHSSANLTRRPDSIRHSFTRCVDDPEILQVPHLPTYKDNRLIKSIVKNVRLRKAAESSYVQNTEWYAYSGRARRQDRRWYWCKAADHERSHCIAPLYPQEQRTVRGEDEELDSEGLGVLGSH